MKEIEKILVEIKQSDTEWVSYKKVGDIEKPDTLHLLDELVTEIRQMIKQEREHELDELPQYVDNDVLCEDIKRFARYTLQHYYAWKIVTDLEKNNPSLVPVLLQNIMEKGVLRIDYELPDTYATYGMDDKDAFVQLLNSFDTLVTYYVQKHLSRKAIIQDIKEETEIEAENAELFADLIDKNYRALQLNIILDKLGETQA